MATEKNKLGKLVSAFVNSMDFKQCNSPEDLESGPFHLEGKVPRVQAVQVKINRSLTRKIEDN